MLLLKGHKTASDFQFFHIMSDAENEPIWRCIPFEFWCRNLSNYYDFLDILIILRSYVIFLTILAKSMEQLVSWVNSWNIPNPNFPKPAPAG